jgi:hypothetical protein
LASLAIPAGIILSASGKIIISIIGRILIIATVLYLNNDLPKLKKEEQSESEYTARLIGNIMSIILASYALFIW